MNPINFAWNILSLLLTMLAGWLSILSALGIDGLSQIAALLGFA